MKGNDMKGNDWKSQANCHRCGVKGHSKTKCRSTHWWASYKESRSNDNLGSTASASAAESQSFLSSVIHSDPILVPTPDYVNTGNMASANRPANYWILDTGATSHVTGNRHLFETFHPVAKWEHQVTTANNSFVDSENPATITLYVDRATTKPAMIVLHNVLYVPACGTTYLLSIIQ